MPVFELQSCVGNYNKLHAGIKNTNVVANNPPIYTKTKTVIILKAITSILYSFKETNLTK